MVKKILVPLPVYLKKFFIHEYNGYQKKNGIDEIQVDKRSELGRLIHLLSRPIPFTQKPAKEKTAGALSIRYYTHVQALDIDVDKLPQMAVYLDEMFRRSLIYEVRGAHELTGCDYGPLVTAFLERRGIDRDVDVDYQTMRKVYRDYISKTNREMKKSYAWKVTKMREK